MSDGEAPGFTAEQRAAIERREGPLLLSAAAGSGKTAVLVERYVRSVLEDGVPVAAVLAITFTEQAAGEMAMRIRDELRRRGRDDLAVDAEEARVSTIHALCHRLLRENALAARIDPGFTVLDAPGADRMARAAYDRALDDLVAQAGEAGADLLARVPPVALRAAVRGAHAALRSRGQAAPGLPEPAERDPGAALAALARACAPAAAELGAVDGKRAAAGAAAATDCAAWLAGHGDGVPAPGELGRFALPGGDGAGLGGAAAGDYRRALADAVRAGADEELRPALRALDLLLRAFGTRYAAAKRAASAVDFADLELLAVSLLEDRADVRRREVRRFRRVLVDELQDVNGVQLRLLELLAPDGWFAVGDAAQSIYAFRHADVELFRARRAALEPAGAALELRTSFRARPELVDAVNLGVGPQIDSYVPLLAGRADPPAADPAVELLITHRGAWTAEEVMPDGAPPPCAAWRMAEARALAARIRALVAGGRPARDVVVLLRAATDLGAYERALDDAGVPTYVIGGRGYWERREVQDLVAWLAVLANTRDEPRLWEVLASPLVGLDAGALVHVAAAARDAGTDPWRVLRAAFAPGAAVAPAGLELAAAAEALPAALSAEARGRLAAFVPWAEAERREAARREPAELVARAVAARGYDLAVLRMPGGARRLANVRKLLRLAREHQAAEGPGLRGFVDAVARRTGREALAEAREGEAPVESEDLDAVRLMTIHRAKGLEFPVVCVADLGRASPRGEDLLRLGRRGEIGLRLRPLGGGPAVEAFDWPEVTAARRAAAEQETRRLFYVAMTRARERLVLCGAVDVERPPGDWRVPLGWIAAGLVPDLAERLARGEDVGVAEREADGRRVPIAYAIGRPGAPAGPAPAPEAAPGGGPRARGRARGSRTGAGGTGGAGARDRRAGAAPARGGRRPGAGAPELLGARRGGPLRAAVLPRARPAPARATRRRGPARRRPVRRTRRARAGHARPRPARDRRPRRR